MDGSSYEAEITSDTTLPILPSQLWPLLILISTVCADIARLVTGAGRSQDGDVKLTEMLDTAFRLEAQLAARKPHLQSVARPRNVDWTYLSPAQDRPPFPRLYITFPSLQHGSLWMIYWSSQLYLLRSLLIGVNVASVVIRDYVPGIHREVMHVRIQEAVDNICNVVPFMLGEVASDSDPTGQQSGRAIGSYFLTRILDTVNEVTFLPKDQRQWTLNILSRIGREWGIRGALEVRDKWASACE
jgi:hypothetical protein